MYFDNSSPIFTPCSKGCYIEKLKSADAENALLIHIENGIPYLRADIEYGGEIHPRIELMNFALVQDESDFSEKISDLNSECRGYYAGGICFIEYENEDVADNNFLYDFLKAYEEKTSPLYMSCKETALKRICTVFPNADIFLLVDN